MTEKGQKELNVDVAIIGAGTAGLNARRVVASHGRSAVLIESGPLGTTCARVGCMPSKLLIAAANAAHEAREAHEFGIALDPKRVGVDAERVFERVRRMRDDFMSGVVEELESMGPDELVRGRARFEDRTTIAAAGRRIKARAVIIATGSEPVVPAPFDALGDRILTNENVFDLDVIPERLAVIGAGVVGLELGQALARLGAEVTIFDQDDRVAFLTDRDVIESAKRALERELTFHFGVSIDEARAGDGGELEIGWEDQDGARQRASYTHVLVAAGRRPRLDGLGLDELDLARTPKGELSIDARTAQIGAGPIFVAGDASGSRPILHEASDEGSIAGRNAALYPDVRVAQRRAALLIGFTEPQIAIVGPTRRDLADGDAFRSEAIRYESQGRARVINENAGLGFLYARERDGKLLGAELCGPQVEHTAHLLAWAIQLGLNLNDLLRLPFYHPTVEEGLQGAARRLAADLRLVSRDCPEDFAEATGR